MSLWSLTQEKKDELLANKQAKAEELRVLRGKTPTGLWHEDLDRFMEELEKWEKQEREDAMISVSTTSRQGGKKGNKGGKGGRPRQGPKLTSAGVVAESLPQAEAEDEIPPVIPQFSEKKEKGESHLTCQCLMMGRSLLSELPTHLPAVPFSARLRSFVRSKGSSSAHLRVLVQLVFGIFCVTSVCDQRQQFEQNSKSKPCE